MSPQDKVTVMDALEELRYSSTTTTSSRKYFAAKAVLSLDTDTVHDDAVSREKFEAVAKIVYDQWVDKEGWKPWVDEGNSFKQDNARKVASQIYAVICS